MQKAYSVDLLCGILRGHSTDQKRMRIPNKVLVAAREEMKETFEVPSISSSLTRTQH